MCEGTHSPLYIVCYTARVRRAQTRAPSMDALRFLIALLPTNQPTNQPRLYIPTFANLKMKKNIYSIPICLSLFIFFHSPLLLAGSTHFRRKAVSSRWSMQSKPSSLARLHLGFRQRKAFCWQLKSESPRRWWNRQASRRLLKWMLILDVPWVGWRQMPGQWLTKHGWRRRITGLPTTSQCRLNPSPNPCATWQCNLGKLYVSVSCPLFFLFFFERCASSFVQRTLGRGCIRLLACLRNQLLPSSCHFPNRPSCFFFLQ